MKLLSVIGLLLGVSCTTVVGQVSERQKSPSEWLDGSWTKLRIKITGEVLNPNGQPAKDLRVTASVDSRDLKVAVTGNKFVCWIPAGKQKWVYATIHATSADGRFAARQGLSGLHVRKAAIDGVRLQLEPTTRSVRVSVVHKGKPQPDCNVRASLTAGTTPAIKTDTKGVATLHLLPSDQISQLTAWADDGRLGGFSFHRDPPRDRNAGEFKIELLDGRRQKIRLVNAENEEPVPDCNFEFVIGMGEPDYQFTGRTPDTFLTTDASGEAWCRWFSPKAKGSYMKVDQLKWYRASKKPEWKDDTLVQMVKPTKPRRRVVGTVKDNGGNPVPGIYVEAWSGDGLEENRFDVLFGFTDKKGRFFMDYLDGSKYSIYVNDSELVAPRERIVVHDPKTQATTRPALVVKKGIPLTIRVTDGEKPAAVPYLWINVRREEESVSRHWGVTTDKNGVASTVILAGSKIKCSVYTPFWREAKEMVHKLGEKAELVIHHDPSKKKEQR